MARQVISPLLVCLVLASCGGAGTQSATTAATAGTTSTATEVDTSTTTPRASTTTVVAGTSDPGRPVAPDFTLDLGEGGVYQLSEGARPVYLVFWAEW